MIVRIAFQPVGKVYYMNIIKWYNVLPFVEWLEMKLIFKGIILESPSLVIRSKVNTCEIPSNVFVRLNSSLGARLSSVWTYRKVFMWSSWESWIFFPKATTINLVIIFSIGFLIHAGSYISRLCNQLKRWLIADKCMHTPCIVLCTSYVFYVDVFLCFVYCFYWQIVVKLSCESHSVQY